MPVSACGGAHAAGTLARMTQDVDVLGNEAAYLIEAKRAACPGCSRQRHRRIPAHHGAGHVGRRGHRSPPRPHLGCTTGRHHHPADHGRESQRRRSPGGAVLTGVGAMVLMWRYQSRGRRLATCICAAVALLAGVLCWV